jgi:nitric oxide reductase NorQ protein
VVRELRGTGVNNHRPTIRASIAMAKILRSRQARAHMDDPVFRWLCRDILHTDTAKVTCEGQSLMPQKVEEAVAKVCGNARKRTKAQPRGAKTANGKDGNGWQFPAEV